LALERDRNQGAALVRVRRPATAREGLTQDLVVRAKEGDKEAFGDLYETYRGPIYRLARFYLPAELAEDATAETFMRAWQALPRYRYTGAPFASWLYAIARHVVTDLRRASRRTEPRAELPDTPGPAGIDHSERLTLLTAMSKLPQTERRVLELKFLIGLGNEEIATVLGKSTGAVNAIRWRALRRLRGVLGE
jgi:RNA polymerase sigma-70 factor (ECF subfamily)